MSRALLAVALVASLSLGSCAPWVYNTVTAVAINPNYMTTIKKFVGTEACAVDDTIFLADFTTCDFQFVEDVVDKAKTISPITCDRSCAQQWGVVSSACYHQFRERMEGDRRFGSQATQFFEACDAKVKVHTNDPASPGGSATGDSTTGGSTTGGSTTGGSATGGSSTGGSATGGSSTGGSGTGGSVAATDIDSATAPAPAEATADPPAAASPDTDLSGGIYVSPSMDESPSMSESPGMDLPPSEPVASPPMVDAEAGAEAPSADLAPGPGPAEAPTPAPAPVPAPAPAPVSSAAISNSVAAAAFALVGAALLLL